MSRRTRRRPMSEINVVPYIDVMLVLLIIFMITAPLLQPGVEVDLPKADAAAMEQVPEEPVIVNVMANGDLYLSIGGANELIDEETLTTKVAAFLRRNADVQVLVGGDRGVPYGRVYAAMTALQKAGADKVGLMSDPLEQIP